MVEKWRSDVKYKAIDEFKGDLAIKCCQHVGDEEVDMDVGFIQPAGPWHEREAATTNT